VLPGAASGNPAGVSYSVGRQPGLLAAADLDGDSHPDVVVPCAADQVVQVLRNAGDGSLQSPLVLPAGTLPTAAAVADINGDAKPDLIVTNFGTGDVYVYLNTTP
jgi:hypothetical protein